MYENLPLGHNKESNIIDSVDSIDSINGQQTPRSHCASAQDDLNLCCLFIETMDIVEYSKFSLLTLVLVNKLKCHALS